MSNRKGNKGTTAPNAKHPSRVLDAYVAITVKSPSGGTYKSVVPGRQLEGYRAEALRLGFEILDVVEYEAKGTLPMCYWPSGIILFEKATRRIIAAERVRSLAALKKANRSPEADSEDDEEARLTGKANHGRLN